MSREGAGTIVTDVPQNAAAVDGTIVADVPSDEERVLQSPRFAAMSQIRVDRDDVGVDLAQAAAGTVAASDDAGGGGVVVAPAGSPMVAAPDAMVEVTIGGVTRLVPVSEAVKGYQIESVARENLRKASETLKEAERIRSTAAPVAVSAAAPVSAESLKGALDLLVEGETEEAAKQLAGILVAPAAVPQVDVQGEVKKALQAEEGQKVFNKFLDEHKELSDPDIYAVCDQIFMREYEPLLAAGALSYDEALRKAASDTRAKFNINPEAAASNPAPAAGTVGRAAVAANKARINNIPSAGGRLPAPAADRPKSTADVIQQMRARRGLS